MDQVINKILDYIEDHIVDYIKLDDVSNLMYYSSCHISRCFNHYVGLSFNEYINKRRLSLAAIMIKNTDKPIQYIAHYYGYNSAKYFSNLFKQCFDISPRNFRSTNYFVDLQFKRIVKGDHSMEVLKLNDLVIKIMKNSSNQNELLDTIAEIENCILYEQKGSNIVLIAYCVNEHDDYELMEIDFNLISGKYVSKLILRTPKRNDVVISKLFMEDQTVYVEYKSLMREKIIQAKLIKVNEYEVEVATNVLTDIEVTGDAVNYMYNDAYFKRIGNKVSGLVDILKKANHEYDLQEHITKDHHLLLLRGFSKEFVLIKLIEDSNYIFLYSIYLNFEENREEINNIYAVNKGDKEVEFLNENNLASIYLDGELHSQSYINVGEEVTPKFIISFPNGMTGRGRWDLSDAFND